MTNDFTTREPIETLANQVAVPGIKGRSGCRSGLAGGEKSPRPSNGWGRSVTANNELESDYYFVPLGQERGSYLDFLGCLPMRTQTVHSKKASDYQIRLKNGLKKRRSVLREQRDAKQITAEEYLAKDEELDAKYNRELADFLELERKFDQLQRERREYTRQGPQETDSTWANGYSSFGMDRAAFWKFLLASRPLHPGGAGIA